MPPPSTIGEDLEAVESRVALRQPFQRQRDMHLLEVARLQLRAAAERAGLRHRRRRAVEVAEQPLDLATTAACSTAPAAATTMSGPR